MFVPGDAFLAAAAERLPDLYAQGMERRVILVTPSSLFALCKAVVYGWRVEAQTINAREIVDLGRELYKRIAVMAAHAQAMGKGLETPSAATTSLSGRWRARSTPRPDGSRS